MLAAGESRDEYSQTKQQKQNGGRLRHGGRTAQERGSVGPQRPVKRMGLIGNQRAEIFAERDV